MEEHLLFFRFVYNTEFDFFQYFCCVLEGKNAKIPKTNNNIKKKLNCFSNLAREQKNDNLGSIGIIHHLHDIL